MIQYCRMLFFSILLLRCVAGSNTYLVHNNADHHSARFAEGITFACDALFDEAQMVFASIPLEHDLYSAALHSLGNIVAINGNLLLSGVYHARAKRYNSTQQPPLAVMYMENVPCNNIGDLFWTSSFVKKKMYETFFSPYDYDRRSLLSVHSLQDLIDANKFSTEETDVLFDSHVGLATQLEDSGLMEYSSRHFTQASILRPKSVELLVRNAVMVPVLYDSVEHLEKTRDSLTKNVKDLIATVEEDGVCLDSLDHLSMPGTFYIVYQGFNDADLMRDIRHVYRILYPSLEKVYLSPEEGYLNPPVPTSDGRIRVGFASHYFRKHSVCKLICGVVRNLDKKVFHVTIFSSTDKEDEWTDHVRERSDRFIHVEEGMLLSNRNIPFDENLDVLVYPDIGMESGSTIWAHSRLAKIQICFWGHPTTSGMNNMDYFITSDL